MEALIIKKRLWAVIKSRVLMFLAKYVYKAYTRYDSVIMHQMYTHREKRLSPEWISKRNQYVDESISGYKHEQLTVENIEKMSEYYIYSQIEKYADRSNTLRIINVG